MPSHKWKFYRAGGLDQVVFRSGQDIVNLRELDQKLWVTLACPTEGLDLDERTLSLLDTDKDGRIRPPEIIAAVEWLRDAYRNPDELLISRDFVPLASINPETEVGRSLLSSAARVLELVGKPGADRIELADVTDRAKIDADVSRNGDGIVPPEAAADPAVQQAIADIVATQGKSTDRSGKDGIGQAQLDAFFTDAAAYLAWDEKAAGAPEIRPLGDATAAAAQAVRAVRAKVEDYFNRCRLAAFEPRALPVLTGTDAELAAVAGQALGDFPAELSRLPLARIEDGRPLPLVTGVNPAWAAPLQALLDAAVAPLLGPGRSTLSPADWTALCARLAAYEAWQAEKPATRLDALGPGRVRQLTEGGFQAQIADLIAGDAALAPEYERIEALEKLVRCQRDLLRLLHNFVSFAEFYGRKGTTFLAGSLYLDQRTCHLCVPVRDAAKHGALAAFSRTYLAYCDLTRPGGAKRSVVAAFTNGDVDNLIVGRNGVFYDRTGADWDATITKIVENPLSLRQAFWSPYKTLIRMIDEQVGKRAAAAEAETKKQLEATAVATAQADKTKVGDTKIEKKGVDVGTVAAIGVAVAGVATFLSGILALFFGLGAWMPLGLLGLMLAISGPAVFVAWLKLRQRNLGPILDANGWAVNGRVKITPLFAGALTDLPHLPRGAEHALRDPFGEPPGRWRLYITLLVLLGIGLAWFAGRIDPLLPARLQSTAVLGSKAPAYRPPVESLERK